MEPIQSDYRLERWLAVLLSLLFFLPFVAKADDIVFATETYHGDELPYRDGESFLGLTQSCVLVPMKIAVSPIVDLGDRPDQKSGKEVSAPGYPEIYLVRGRNLHPGLVHAAQPDFSPLLPETWKAKFTLAGKTPYDLSYRCDDHECTLVLQHDERTQDLVTIPIEREGKKINTLEVRQYVVFAGDLDHDGRLDLIANLQRHWNEWRPVLLLSSTAKNGEIVGLAAELSTSGC